MLLHVACAHTQVLLCVLFPGVVDEMALALELSRRQGQPRHPPPKPQIQNRSPAESGRSHPSPLTAATHRSFSSAPFYHYGVAAGSEDDEEDEELQMALACSLSEMEAQQRAAATDFISGAGGGVRVMNDKAGGHKRGGVVKTTNSEKIVAGEKDEERQFKMGPGPGGRWDEEGKGIREPGFSPESPSTANTTPPSQSSEEEFEPAIKNSDDSVKKKKKCRCIVC